MKFYTGKGDSGQTALFGSGDRMPKTGPIFEALGALDELNSYLGVCKALAEEDKIKNALKNAQENLFIIQAEIGGAKNIVLGEDKTKKLEKLIDEFGGFVGQITKFAIPGGNPLSAHLDFGRAFARRTERRVLKIQGTEFPLGNSVPKYLNRLSSLLFVLARYANKKTNTPEDHPNYK